MVDHSGHIAARIVLRDVPDRVQVVRQGPLYGFISPIVNIFLGQNLVHRRSPQIPPLQVACLNLPGAGPPEVEHDLVPVVDENPPLVGMAVAVAIQAPADPAVGVVVGVLDHPVHRRGVTGPMLHLDQPVAVVPSVLGDVGVALVELAVLVGVDEPQGAVPVDGHRQKHNFPNKLVAKSWKSRLNGPQACY